MVMEVLTRPKRYAVKEGFHVFQATDWDPHLANFSLGQRMVGIVADLGGQVEGHGEAGLALLQQVAVPLVRVGGGPVTGILAHGPDAAAVGVGLHSPGEGELPRIADIPAVVRFLGVKVRWNVKGVDCQAAVGLKGFLPFREPLHGGL